VVNPHATHGAHSEEWRRSARLRWKVLHPAGKPRGEEAVDDNYREEPGFPVYSTIYVSDELIVAGANRDAVREREGGIVEIARRAGWSIDPLNLEDDRSQSDDAPIRARLSVAPSTGSAGSGVTAQTPDAWEVLRQARADNDGSADGVSLNHVLTTDSYGLNPFTANPFTANPFTANPFTANPFTANAPGVGIASYGALGFGGRQPVTYRGPDLVLDPDRSRPVVAIFDTGLGAHPWFGGNVALPPRLPNNDPIGILDPQTDPEVFPSLSVPLDGIFDDASGHGTFIAGIIRQECPEAQILPVRVADGEGIILESELIGSLRRLIDYTGQVGPVHVLNLSFSFYHETPDDPNSISEIAELLRRLRDDHDVVVVCSAGNEATDRPTLPAALPNAGERQISVGALNPADRSVALFSNIGDWVDVFAPGVSLVSTVPVDFDGGIRAGTRDDRDGRRRETLDVDDFRGGFGVWSGTSFAAPVVAGQVAAQIADGFSSVDAVISVIAEVEGADRSR
jgi:serine protease